MKKSKYRQITSALLSNVWAILPEKLDEISAFLELKASGVMFTPEDIAARVGQSQSLPPIFTEAPPKNLAVIECSGTIAQKVTWLSEFSGGASTELMGKQLDAALADDSVETVLFCFDTPGGTVTGVEELATKIYQGRDRKKIIGFGSGSAVASAGIWLASACTELVLTPSLTDCGSIGVLQVHRDRSDGKTIILRTAPNKALVNSFEKLTPKAKAFHLAKMQKVHERFVADVARNLGVTAEHVEKEFGNGGTMTARDAVEVGLAHRVMSADELFEELGASLSSDVSISLVPINEKDATAMTPKVKLALIRAGLCLASAPAADFEAALKIHCEAEGLKVDASEEVLLKSFLAKQPERKEEPAKKPEKKAEQVSSELVSAIGHDDIRAMISVCDGIPDGEKFSVLSEISAKVEAGDITTMTGVQNAIQDHKKAASKPAGSAVSAQVTAAASDKLVDAGVTAILVAEYGTGSDGPKEFISAQNNNRASEFKPDVADGDNRLRTITGLGRVILESSGFDGAKVSRLSNEEVVRVMCGAHPADVGLGAWVDGPAYNTTGLFRGVLANSKQTVARKEYRETEVSYTKWATRGAPFTDFEKRKIKALGSLTDPQVVPEDGEFEEQTIIGAESEEVQLHVWGGIFSHTWQMMLADDLRFFVGVERKMVRRLRRKQDVLATLVLLDNPTMGDGNSLFDDTNHSNDETVATAADLFTEATIKAVRKKLIYQQGVGADENPDYENDSDPLGFKPHFLLHPPELTEAAAKYITSRTASGQSNPEVINPHLNLFKGGHLELERLGAECRGGVDDQYFVTADPRDAEAISYHFFQNNDAPRIEVAEAFSSLAFRTRVWVPFGVSAKDWRGIVRVRVS